MLLSLRSHLGRGFVTSSLSIIFQPRSPNSSHVSQSHSTANFITASPQSLVSIFLHPAAPVSFPNTLSYLLPPNHILLLDPFMLHPICILNTSRDKVPMSWDVTRNVSIETHIFGSLTLIPTEMKHIWATTLADGSQIRCLQNPPQKWEVFVYAL